jgi:hypothetical protein
MLPLWRTCGPNPENALVESSAEPLLRYSFFGFLAIGLTVGATNAINGSVENVAVFADRIGAFGGDIGTDLRSVNVRLNAQVDAVNAALASFSFSDIFDVIFTLDQVLANVNSEITFLNNTIYYVDSEYQAIISNYTYLQQKERDGKISNVPQNSSIIESPRDNDQLLINSKSNLNTYDVNVAAARAAVDIADSVYRAGRDAAIKAAKDSVNGVINEQINVIAAWTSDLTFSRQNIDKEASAYIKILNDSRMGVVITFVLLNLIAMLVWIVGHQKNKPLLTESPYWVSAFTVFWIMTFAAVHIVLFIPVRDLCDRKIAYIQSPGVNNKLRTLIPSALLSVSAFSDLLNKITNDPLLILNCGKNETFFSRTSLTLFDFIPAANDTLTDLINGFSNETSKIDVNTEADQSLSAFGKIQANLTQVSGKIANYTLRIRDSQSRLSGIEPQLVQNLNYASGNITQLENDLNALTIPFDGRSYTRYNYTVPLPGYTASPNAAQINDTAYTLDFANTTYNDAVVEANDIRRVVQNMNDTFNRVSVAVNDIGLGVSRVQGDATLAENSLRTMKALQQNFIDSTLNGIAIAISNAREILKLGDVGKCFLIGDFYRTGIEQGVCTNIKNSVGGAGVVLCFFGILMFFSTWPIVWTRPALFEDEPKERKDEGL